jgi:hypothetical protein
MSFQNSRSESADKWRSEFAPPSWGREGAPTADCADGPWVLAPYDTKRLNDR